MNIIVLMIKKEICKYIGPDISLFYEKDSEYHCIEKCLKKYGFCLKCNKTICEKCASYTNTNNEGVCEVDPTYPQDKICLVNITEISDNITDIDLNDFPYNYYPNFPSFYHVDHYVNMNYTVSVFIHPECTDGLLDKGYFKIDSKELQDAIIKKFNSNENVTFSVFVTYNFDSHLRYYNEHLKYLDIDKLEDSESIKNIEYIIKNKFIKIINELLGPIVSGLIENEKINLFERDSDIYKDYCKNLTFLGIDMPLKKRILLYLQNLTDQALCLGKDCVLEELNLDELVATCKCKIGNKFEDILKSNNYTRHTGSIEKANNFLDSIGIIKCAGNGFNSKNMKANAGFFLGIIGIVAQMLLFLYYSIFRKVISLPKLSNNPPKKSLILMSDWDTNNKKRNDTEDELFIQPRDDDDEQLIEEERSYINDGINISNISIDTNVEGENSMKDGKKGLSEKPQKKILILLNNKGSEKKNLKKEYEESSSSDNEIIKLNDEKNLKKLSFCLIYWSVASLKQHIINFFSFIHCCKITKSYIPLPMRIIRSIFLVFLSFIFNILFLNQDYYEKKFNHFNEKYIIINSDNPNLKISSGAKIGYAISNTFAYAMISFILLIFVNFIVGYIFFSIRNILTMIIKNNKISEINELVSKTKKKNLIFFIINIILMIIFLLTITAFVGAYGGGFVDYFVAGIISLIFLEIFPFLSSLGIAALIYFGNNKKIKWCYDLGQFFMF